MYVRFITTLIQKELNRIICIRGSLNIADYLTMPDSSLCKTPKNVMQNLVVHSCEMYPNGCHWTVGFESHVPERRRNV